MLTNAALVAVSAALGGMGRFAVTNLAVRLWGTAFPWGTLLVNASGAFVAGLLLGRYGFETLADSSLGLLLITGLLGGYTTVSSLSLQTLTLWQGQNRAAALGTLGATLFGALLLAALGWGLAANTF